MAAGRGVQAAIRSAARNAAVQCTTGTPAARAAAASRAMRRLMAAGAQLVRGPEDGPHETRAVLRDPAGNQFVIYAPRR